MSYINLSVFNSSGLKPADIFFLAQIKQTETEYLIEKFTDSDYNRFKELNLIEHIKQGKKDEHLYKSLRLSQQGKDLMSELEEAVVEEQDDVVFLWLAEHYVNIGKEVGNKARTKRHIRDFRIKSGLQKNNLIKVCLDFIKDDDVMVFNNVLEFAFYKAPTAFQTRFNLEDSRLYKHYLKHKKRLEPTFEQY